MFGTALQIRNSITKKSESQFLEFVLYYFFLGAAGGALAKSTRPLEKPKNQYRNTFFSKKKQYCETQRRKERNNCWDGIQGPEHGIPVFFERILEVETNVYDVAATARIALLRILGARSRIYLERRLAPLWVVDHAISSRM